VLDVGLSDTANKVRLRVDVGCHAPEEDRPGVLECACRMRLNGYGIRGDGHVSAKVEFVIRDRSASQAFELSCRCLTGFLLSRRRAAENDVSDSGDESPFRYERRIELVICPVPTPSAPSEGSTRPVRRPPAPEAKAFMTSSA
jgi:hypothetical protein